MKSNKNSELGLLMKILGIKGYDLAQAIHVDYSLISKWKTMKRQPSEAYLSAIAEYSIEIDRVHGLSRVNHFVLEHFPSKSPEEISNELPILLFQCLSRSYLLNTGDKPNISEYNSNHYSSAFDVFTGREGRRQAVLRFLKQAISLPKGQHVNLISQEDMLWMVEDHLYLSDWSSLFSKLVERECTINSIHKVDRSDMKDIIPFIEIWLSQHMTGHIKSWYFPNYEDNFSKSTIMILSGEAAIASHSSQYFPLNLYSAYYTDPGSVNHYEEYYNALLKKCVPLTDVIPFEDPQNLVIQLKKSYHRKGKTINFSDTLTFDSMPTDLLVEIIEENGVSKKLADRLLHAHKDLFDLRFQNVGVQKKFIYNLESIENSLEKDLIYCSDLSILLNKKIFIRKNQFKRHVSNIILLISADLSCEVGLVSKNDSGYIKNINIWIKENNMMLITSTIPDIKKLSGLSISEPTFVNAYFNFYLDIWKSIPPIYRDNDYVVATLNSLLT